MKSLLVLFLTICFAIPILKSQSIELDKQLGISSSKEIEEEMGIYLSPTSAYVGEIGHRLLEKVNHPFSFMFKIVDSPIPNAFALPGGYVYITRGLLALSNSEDELAGVLGHEISHVLERHSIQHIKKSILPALVQVPGKLLGKIDNGYGQLFNAPLSLSSDLYLASYSRGQEYEADDIGTKIAANSGYEPEALAVILSNLGMASEIYTGEKEKRSYFDDHPITSKRIDRIQKISSKITPQVRSKIANSQSDYYAKIEGLLYGDNPDQGVFLENTFLHPVLNISIDFPSGWETINTPFWVGAYNEEENAMIHMALMDSIHDISHYSNEIVQMVKKKGDLSPLENKKISINGFESYYLLFHVIVEDEIYEMSFLWINNERHIYQITSFGLVSAKELIDDSIFSFREPDINAIKSIHVNVIKITEAKGGESIEEFNHRTGNIWNLEYTAIANGLKKEALLTQGQLLKIIISQPYIIP